MFDPAFEALPNLGVLVVLLVGTARVSSGSIDRRRSRGGGVPVHAARVPDPRHRLRARGAASQRRRLGSGRIGARCERSACRRAATPVHRRQEPGRLQVQHVSFRYDSAREDGVDGDAAFGTADVLHDVSFEVEPGKTVAIVGPTGSGKSTLTALIVRLVDPVPGQIRLDGVDLRSTAGRRGVRRRPRSCRSRRSSSTTPSAATSRSVLDVPDDDVREALRLAQAERFVDALPRGPRHPHRRARHHAVGRPASATGAGPCAGPPAAPARARRRDVERRPAGRGTHPGRITRRRGPVDRGRRRLSQGDHLPSPTRSSTSSTAGSSIEAPTRSCFDAATATGSLVTAYERAEAERLAIAADGAEPVDRWTTNGRAWHDQRNCRSRGDRQLVGDHPPRPRPVARVPARPTGHTVARAGRHRWTCRRAGHRPADRRPRAARRPAGRTSSCIRHFVLLAALVIACTAAAAYAMNVRLYRTTESGTGHAAHAGLPARPRPVDPYPERGTTRLDGLPRHQRRRHDQHVHAVGRRAAHRQPRPADRGHRPDGRSTPGS